MAKQLLAQGSIFAGQFWRQLLSFLLPSIPTTQQEFLKTRLSQSSENSTYSLLAAFLLPIAHCFCYIQHRYQSYLKCEEGLALARHPLENFGKSIPTEGLQKYLLRHIADMQGYLAWRISESSTPKLYAGKFLIARESFLFLSSLLFECIHSFLCHPLSWSKRLLVNAFSRRTSKHTAKQLFLLNRFLNERLVFQKHALLNP